MARAAELGPSDGSKSFAPMLIRITARIVERNGRLGDGLTQEYVFKVR